MTSDNSQQWRKATGCPPLSREKINPIIKLISDVTKIDSNDLHRLGSSAHTSNKPTVGDVDLAVDITKYNFEEINKRMMTAFDDSCSSYNPGTKVGSYCVPFEDSCVQVDLMFVHNIQWSTFAYISHQGNGPHYEKYKGVVRNILLQATTTTTAVEGFTFFKYQNDRLIARTNFVIDFNVGMKRKCSYLKTKPSGEYYKTETVVSLDEFLTLFPESNINTKDQLLNNDPQEIAEFLFGSGTQYTQLETVDQLLELFDVRFNNERQQQIFSKAKQLAKSMLRERYESLELPQQIKEATE